jgi:hypothetical protein
MHEYEDGVSQEDDQEISKSTMKMKNRGPDLKRKTTTAEDLGRLAIFITYQEISNGKFEAWLMKKMH